MCAGLRNWRRQDVDQHGGPVARYNQPCHRLRGERPHGHILGALCRVDFPPDTALPCTSGPGGWIVEAFVLQDAYVHRVEHHFSHCHRSKQLPYDYPSKRCFYVPLQHWSVTVYRLFYAFATFKNGTEPFFVFANVAHPSVIAKTACFLITVLASDAMIVCLLFTSAVATIHGVYAVLGVSPLHHLGLQPPDHHSPLLDLVRHDR